MFGKRLVAEVNNEPLNLAFHNLAPEGFKVAPTLRRLLGLNLNFIPAPRLSENTRKRNWSRAISDLERSTKIALFFRDSPERAFNRNLYVPNPLWQPDNELPIELKNWFEKAYKSEIRFQRFKDNLSKQQRRLLNDLTKRNDVVITESDKNLGPCLLSKDQYVSLCEDHLSSSAYRKEEVCDISHIRTKIRQLYSRMLDRGLSNQDIRIIIHCLENSEVPKFRGIPKLHKLDQSGAWNRSMRPIVSCINSPTRGLSKWLDYNLKPFLLKTETFLRDSDHFLDHLTDIRVEATDELYTLDARSLYTSIPTDQALIILEKIREGHPLEDLLLDAATIVLRNNLFEFQGKIYQQTTGLAMGTPAAPTLASLYISFFEERYITRSKLWGREIVLLKRFIDDIVLIWRPNAEDKYSFNFFKALLRKQTGIIWDITSTNTRSISFLDLEISIEKDSSLRIKTYQKQLNLYLYTPFRSSHPRKSLTGLIRGIALKYLRQNTLFADFKRIFCKFLTRLVFRGYPRDLIISIGEKLLKDASQDLLKSKTSERNSSSERPLFLKIPYDMNGPSQRDIYCDLDIETLNSHLNEGRGNDIVS